MPTDALFVAIDARLVGGNSTGDSTYWTCLVQALIQSPDCPSLRLYSDKPKPNLPFLANVEWVHLPAKNSRWWSLVAFPLAARHGLVHTQYTLSPLVRNGITTIHDVSFFVGPEWFQPRDRLLLQRTIPASARRAKRIITVSETSRAEIERFIPVARGKVDVTPLACPPWIQRTSEPSGIDGPYVLTVSTRWPRKNMSLAVEAMSLLPESIPHKLVLTGKHGWGSSDLGARGIATGYVSEERLSALYSHASLYLSPSRHEGFGIPVLEAMRCGCPVLASTGGALPETVGNAGIIEPSWDPKDWAKQIEFLLSNPQELDSLKTKGHTHEQKFTWRETARKTTNAYKENLQPQRK